MRCGERLREKVRLELRWEGRALVDEEGSVRLPVPESYAEVYKLDRQGVRRWGPVRGLKLVDYALARGRWVDLLEITRLGGSSEKALIEETVEKFASSALIMMAAGFSPRKCYFKLEGAFPLAALEGLLRREWREKWVMKDVCEVEVEVLADSKIWD